MLLPAGAIPVRISDDVVPFSAIADKTAPDDKRVDAARRLIQLIGNTYRPECLATCGLSRLCRERAEDNGDPCRVGGSLLRLLPGIESIDRAYALAHGAVASAAERPVAQQLARAQRVYDHCAVTVQRRKGSTR
jgi:hypothetical protein